MQRERARERIDRARRQWEIENGQIDPSGVGALCIMYIESGVCSIKSEVSCVSVHCAVCSVHWESEKINVESVQVPNNRTRRL